ncbi:MAG: metallophosphoesterase [Treponema sp.]|nr:metallophosphoesterase [Treponema sp.]
MVKKLFKFLLIFLIISAICFFSGCNIDLPGLFISNDLDERLKDRDNFIFLADISRNWKDPARTLGYSYKFIVLSDTHFENGKALSKNKKTDLKIHLKDIVDKEDIKFVVITGDITQDTTAKDIDKFIEIADYIGVPCYPVAGNHDIYYRDDAGKKGKAGWSIWREKIGSTSYRIDFDTTSLFILDSANAFLGKDQLDWLEREINNKETKDKDYVFVFTHATLFVTGPADMQQMTDTKERARILSILRNKCNIMFMGHLHKHMENTAGGVLYLSLESFIDDSAYYIVSVSPDNVKPEKKHF